MTKKDYELIARAIGSVRRGLQYMNTKEDAVDQIIYNLGFELEDKNPRFKKDLFYKVCGYRGK